MLWVGLWRAQHESTMNVALPLLCIIIEVTNIMNIVMKAAKKIVFMDSQACTSHPL